MSSNSDHITTESVSKPKIDYNQEPVITIANLQKSFGDNHVIKGFNLSVYPGENVAVLGKSGSGKSVLIKCLVGLLPYDAGSAKVLGQEIINLDQKQLDILRSEIGFLFQGSALYDSMTVRENLEFPLRRHINRLKGQQTVEEKVTEVLESVGLSGTEDLMPEELSGGMKKRIALARTLIINPKVIFYDEPTSGLDPITSKEISHLILKIQKQYGTSSIIITHDVECAHITSNRMVLLIDGQNYINAPHEELKKSNDPKVRAFLG